MRMSRQDGLRCLLLLGILIGTPFLVERAVPGPGQAAPPETPPVVELAQETKSAPAAAPEHGEDPEEADKIDAALLEQGYYSDAIPLSYYLQDILATSCEANGVPRHIALGVIQTESRFCPDAVGQDGHDFGLFQLRDSNHSWLMEQTGADPMTPAGNVQCGVYFLAYLYDRYDGDWPAALTAWRYGRDNGRRSYAEAVLAAAAEWEAV